MRLQALLALALPALALADAPARRAFTVDDLYRLKTVGGSTVSPDGKTIVYTVRTTDLPTMKARTNLWRVDPDGKAPTQLTYSEAVDDQAVFSPDGSTLAFVSTRSGEPQLYLLPLAGGEPRQRTSFPGGVGGPVFSPDGKTIALTADVYPRCGADAECNRKLDEARSKSKLKAHLADTLLYRHWNAWKDGKRTHVLLVDLAKETDNVRDMTPGDFDSPPFSLGGSASYAFSPDGKELAFTSNRDADQASSTNSDIYVVSLAASAEELKSPRNLTAKNAAWDGQPRYSPDGKTLAYRRQAIPRYESDRFRITLLDRQTGATRELTEWFDNWVDDFAFGRDGRKIYFVGQEKARTPIYEVDVATGKGRVVTAVGQLDAWEVSGDGAWAVVARRRIHQPTELYRIAVDPRAAVKELRLTRHNEAVENEVDIRPAEEMWIEGAAGRKVHTWVVKPHGFDPTKKYPVIVNVHGGPQSQWADAFRGDWQVYPGQGYIVVFPNPHGSTGFGQEYTAAISGDWNGKVMEDVRRVTAEVGKLPYVDAERMGAMGWSWGGWAMMWIEGHKEEYGFKALASMMGTYDLRAMYSSTEELWFPEWDLKGTPWDNPKTYAEQSPSGYVTKFRTPCLVITGERDYRLAYTLSLEFFTDLQKMNVPSRLIVFENAGHWPAWYEMALYYVAHLDWFHKYLGGGPAPYDVEKMVQGTAFEKE